MRDAAAAKGSAAHALPSPRGRALFSLTWLSLGERSVAVGQRSRTCLTGVPAYPAEERRNVTVGGFTGPLKLGVGAWDSSYLMTWVVRIFAEEALGIHTHIPEAFSGSAALTYAVFGCKDAANYVVDPQCGVPGEPLVHAVLTTWQVANVRIADAELSENYPAWYPINLGSMGFKARDGFLLKKDSLAPALERQHLSLEYYMAYTHPLLNISDYFDSPFAIRSDDLLPCTSSEMDNSHAAKVYLDITGDREGVKIAGGPGGGAYSMNCTSNRWWLSPQCRADPSRCLPVLTAGNGWGVQMIFQRAHAFKVPLAVAIAKDWETYTRLVRDLRVMFFWWFPDATFLRLDPSWMVWPPHDEGQWDRNVLTSHEPTLPVVKWAYHEMAHRASVNTQRLLASLGLVRFTNTDLSQLMSAYIDRAPGDESLEAVACQWLNNNTDRWKRDWIPVDTNCLHGQGLVEESGAFVDTRAEAKSCAWCGTGRISVGLNDNVGTTHRCKRCSLGEYQATIGMTACERCPTGKAASQEGLSRCDRCTFGEFAASTGSRRCEKCSPGFITSFEGATSSEACLCGEGLYRDQTERNVCKKCKDGMRCPAGSDALGFDPGLAARYTVTPLLTPGHWSSAAEPLSVFGCDSVAKCPGDRAPGHACVDRLEGRACAHCSAGYEWTGEECATCVTGPLKFLLFPALPLLLLPIGVAGLYWASIDTYAEWCRWENGVGSMLFILLNDFHIINVIRGTNTAFSPAVATTYEYFSFATDLWGVFQIGCYGFKTFTNKLVLQSLGPIWLFVGYAITWGISQVVGRRYPVAKLDINRTVSGFFSIILGFFTGITDMALTIFKCMPNPSGEYSLMRDRSIICYKGEWTALSAVGILAVLFFCGGFTLIFIWAIWTVPSRFHKPCVQVRWRFLFVRYRPDVHWWSLVFLAKGILVNLCTILSSAGLVQILWILAVVLAYTAFTVTFRPWRHGLNNTVDVLVHFILIWNCAIMLWFAKEPAVVSIPYGDGIADLCVQAAAYCNVSLALPFGVLLWWLPRLWRARHARDLELLHDTIHLLATSEGCDSEFFDHLSEHDYQLMMSISGLIQTEVAGRKCRRGYSTMKLHKLDMREVRSQQSQRNQSRPSLQSAMERLSTRWQSTLSMPAGCALVSVKAAALFTTEGYRTEYI